MKRIIPLLLSLLLCFGCLIPAFAEDAAEPTEPTEEETTALPADTSWDPQGPEAATEPNERLSNRYAAWKSGDLYSGMFDSRPKYDKAFRRFYANDPDLTIVDHLVLCKREATRWRPAHYALLDYFDTDEAEQSAATLRIPREVNGLPVEFFFYCDSDYSAGLYSAGYSNDTVKKVILDEGFVGTGMFAFQNFTALKTVRLPSSLTTVSISSFEGCKNLKKILGGENITTVQSSAFAGCEKLASFPNMEKLKRIEGSAFSGCGFKSLTLSGNVSLSDGDEDHYSAWCAFAGCKKLKTVTFLNGSKKKGLWIGHSTFQNCTALKTVNLPQKSGDVWIFDKAFSGCTALKTVNNTGKVDDISRYAFENCAALETLILPAGIKTVSEDAFKGCKSLKSLWIKSKDPELFNRNCSSGWWYNNDTRDEVTSNFVMLLPKTCTVLVKNKTMKQTVKDHGFRGTVKIKVTVEAPKKLKAAKQGKTVLLKWSAAQKADGYRVYAVDAETGKLTPLKTVKAPTTTVTLNTSGKAFAVRAFRVIDGDVSWSEAVYK